ncbi:hypothetical protein M0P48_02670 [Candidatus Gracilibacteria bacterium]|nr:hypothetical protein [Candidatus Gracilibacteria bacterium]
MAPEAQTPESWDGETERRTSPIDPKRTILTLDEKALLVADKRFGGIRPPDLATQNFKEGDELKQRVARLFDRLEGKVDAKKLEALKASFESSLATWEKAGLFSKERVARGFRKPDFAKDYQPLIGVGDTEMMEAGEGLDKGYGRAVWAPEDVPVADEDPETLTYLKLAEEALIRAYKGTVGGKKPNTLLVGPDKRVLTADQIDLKNILWQWERYKKPGIVYNPKELDPKNHGGQSEVEMLAALKGTEKETGGVFRLERDQLIMPKDIGQDSMSGQDWHALIKDGKTLPSNVRAQDVKQALAYVINCLNTQGWVPDYYDWNNLASSKVVLAPETYIPDESSAGAVPAFYWNTNSGRFRAAGNSADLQFTDNGVRGGVRKNKETA